MIQIENRLGTVEISSDYFANLVGHAASGCFGVAGMVDTNATQSLRSIASKGDLPDKGVSVRYVSGALQIDLHIAVVYGINISAIVKSIMHKVSYTVEEVTGIPVEHVNVFVDGMRTN